MSQESTLETLRVVNIIKMLLVLLQQSDNLLIIHEPVDLNVFFSQKYTNYNISHDPEHLMIRVIHLTGV